MSYQYNETEKENAVRKYGRAKTEELIAFAETKGEGYASLGALIEENERIAERLAVKLYRLEGAIRRKLIAEYGEVSCSRRNYMYELSNSVGAHQNPLACDSVYPDFIAAQGTVADYLRAVDFDTLIRVYMLLPKVAMEECAATPVWEHASGNLFAAVRVKHTLCHGGSCLGGFGQGTRYDGHGDCVLNGVVDNSLQSNEENIDFLLSGLEK